ncbi:hypothetical protein BGX23_000814 [Mortierella sp. AD031]|nr:hypothetical protein BGX23_000814 [Mortierella sp. AD031]
MHDQQYLLVGSGNALHSIDLTFSNHQQHQQGAGSSNSSGTTGGAVTASAVGNIVRTHIQGLAFKEIHCLEEIGLVVVIAGRNSRVRCYDYDAINRLVAYGHSAQGRGRVVDGGKLGAVKNMIQLRVETAFLRQDDQQGTASDGPHSSPPAGMTGASANRASRGTAATATGGATAAGQAPTGIAGTPQQGQQPLRQNRHQHTTSLDRSLLSPPAQSDSPGLPLEPIRDEPDAESSITTGAVPPCATNYRKHKQRPLSFGGLASLAQENVMRKTTPKDPSDTSSNNNSNNNNKIPSATTMASHSTPSSPSSATASGVAIGGINNSNSSITNNTGSSGATPTKNKRLSQMASYLSHAAVSSNMAAHITNAQDAPSEEAVGWAWDFTKLKQTKDVIGLDFHYTTTTVFMTVVSKTAIDIYCRSRSARGRKPPAPTGGFNSNGGNSASRTSYSGAETPGRTSMSSIGSGGMAMATSPENPHLHRDYSLDPYEWKLYKQFYHPEPPSFMTVVKGPTEVTDIILGKGPRACVINVEDMSVTDLHRQETSSVIHGLSRKLGFRNSSLWHSFEKIPFDVPPHILFPAAAEAMYGSGERKGTNSRPLSVYSGGSSGNSNSASSSGGAGGTGGGERRSRDNILQRSSDQQTIHQQELEEQEREEAAHALALKLQNTQLNNNLGVPYHPAHYRGSSSSSPPSSTSSSNSSSSITLPAQQYQQPPSTNVPTSTATATAVTTKTTAAATKTRMVTSDEVLNLAFSQRTTGQLFLATYGSQSRIVDLQGKPQSRVVLDWESAPPQKVAFLKTVHDIYVVGFEKASIVIFSLTRAKKVREILKRDLIQATARDSASASAPAPPPSNNNNNTAGAQSSLAATAQALTNAATSSSSSSSYSSSLSSSSSASIKFLGRDSMAEDSLGLFFSYCHPKNGVSLCQLAVVPLLAADELELIGYYP